MMRAGVALLVAGCAAPLWADQVVDAPGADASRSFGDPTLAANGAVGAGPTAGGFDVYTIDPALGRTHLTLGFSGGRVFDGPGPDLVVFENPFEIAGGGVFMEPAVVEVSSDGERFVAFPHAYLGPPEGSADPAHWVGFAGITPVAHDEPAGGDPFDPDAGGDRFDLADLPGDAGADARERGVLHVRIIPAGSAFPADPIADGPDVDAVYARGFSR